MKLPMPKNLIVQMVDLQNESKLREAHSMFDKLRTEGGERYQAKLGSCPEFEAFKILINSPEIGCQIFQATIDGQGVGIAITQTCMNSWTASRAINVHDFFVEPNFRGMGIGRQIILKIEEACRLHSFRSISLETNIENVDARRLYKTLGFSGTGISDTGVDIAKAITDSSLVLQMKKQIQL